MTFKLKMYLAEPIIRLLISLVLLLFTVSIFNLYSSYHARHYYEKPLIKSIKNQNKKGQLGHIIQRELLFIDANYRTMLLSNNKKKLSNLIKKITDSIKKAQKVLLVLKSGGSFIDVQPVNFYDKDKIQEEITYLKADEEQILVDVIDLGPKLVELNQFIKKTSLALNKRLSDNTIAQEPYDFELSLTILQTEAILLRLKESVNKIYYDIKVANSVSEKQIEQAQQRVQNVVVAIDIISALVIILFSALIALKIFQILKKNKEIGMINKKANEDLNIIIDNIPVGVILVNSQKKIIQINEPAAKILKYNSKAQAEEKLKGRRCNDGFCDTDADKCPILDLGESRVYFTEERLFSRGKNRGGKNEDDKVTILKSVIPIRLNDEYVLMEVFIDISERKRNEFRLGQETRRANRMAQKAIEAEKQLKEYSENLENMVVERTSKLQLAMDNLKDTQIKLLQSEKLASIGQLASGIAHEINTPIQYVGDNTRFLLDAFNDMNTLLKKYGTLINDPIREITMDDFIKEMKTGALDADIDYLQEEIPKAVAQTLEGIERVSEIVRSMKEFSHPGAKEKISVDINQAIKNTVMVSRNEWKYVAEMETDLAPGLPMVPCLPGELNQVILNLIINAAQSIGDIIADDSDTKGLIHISTCQQGQDIAIRVRDTGTGIPEEIHGKIFDLFFTTKDVGKGTGQGLAISHSVIVEKHGGDLSFTTQKGKGTTFIIRIPIRKEEK